MFFTFAPSAAGANDTLNGIPLSPADDSRMMVTHNVLSFLPTVLYGTM